MRLIDADALFEALVTGDIRETHQFCYPCKKVLEAIDAQPTVEPQLDEWCDDCAEYDKERHCCPRFNRVIRTTLDDVRKDAYKLGKSKGIKRGMAIAKRKHEEEST